MGGVVRLPHECGHIIRLFKAAPSQRRVPETTMAQYQDVVRMLEREAALIPVEARFNLLRHWINGLVLQLTNLPVDLKIEKWIFNDYPGLRAEQRDFLRADAAKVVQAMGVEVEAKVIPKVFFISGAMTYAYSAGIGKLTGEKYEAAYARRPDIARLGKKLYALCGAKDDSFAQDRVTIGKWSELLEIQSWFGWRDFEDIPEGYYRG